MEKLEYEILEVYALERAMGDDFTLPPGTKIYVHEDDIAGTSDDEVYYWLLNKGVKCIHDIDTYPKNSPITIFQVEYPD